VTGRTLAVTGVVGLALWFGASAARAQAGPPDFTGNCQKAAGAKANVDPATVTVRGKSKAQDGRINVGFVLADGRVGVCRAKADASVDEVKVEDKKKVEGAQ
jgi:hypothetical protein